MLFSLSFYGQLFIFLSYIVFWFALYCKSKKTVLKMTISSYLVAYLGFIFTYNLNGTINNTYGIIRSFVGVKMDNFETKKRIPVLVSMLTVLLLIYYFTYDGVSTLCLAVCGVLNLIGSLLGDAQWLRKLGLAGGVFYAMFLLFSGSVVGFVCELITDIVLLTSYIKYRGTSNHVG